MGSGKGFETGNLSSGGLGWWGGINGVGEDSRKDLGLPNSEVFNLLHQLTDNQRVIMHSTTAAFKGLYCLNIGVLPQKSMPERSGVFLLHTHVLGQCVSSEVFQLCASAPFALKGILICYFAGTLLPSLSKRLCYHFRLNGERSNEFAILSKNEENSVFWCIGWTLWLPATIKLSTPSYGETNRCKPQRLRSSQG